jgi:hypothetical protein
MGRLSFRALCALVGVLIAGAVPATASAQLTGGIPAGRDALVTDSQNSFFQLGLPPGFFGPGCDPVNFNEPFGGNPLGPVGGGKTPPGNADTVVERLAPIPPDPDNEVVPIQIVALSLTSMQPIVVNCDGGDQHWMFDVRLSSNQQPGQMIVTAGGPGGGHLDAQLPIFPLLTFTRVAGGPKVERTVDIGETSSIVKTQFFFNLQNVPWHEGPCQFPGFSGGGVNDGMCVGQAPGDQALQPLLALSNFVQQGVQTAQPALEHFKCYLTKRKRFKRRTVRTADQFGESRYRVKKRKELCNPVQKRREPWLNRAAHQQCYAVRGEPVNQPVAVLNQFGIQNLVVKRAQRLCLPTRKRELRRGRLKPIRVPIEHFTCYGVRARSPLYSQRPLPGKIRTKDQFRRERVKLGRPKWLCAPTDKEQEGLDLSIQHEVCYAIKGRKARKRVQIKNQFERKRLRVTKPKLLCVPSAKHAFNVL